MFDPEGTGSVECSCLRELLGSAGIRVSAETLDELVGLLEADQATQLQLSEVVDIAAVLASSLR